MKKSYLIKSFVYLTLVWFVILVSLLSYNNFSSPLILIPIIFLVSSRQHALLIIEHECWHNNFSKNKWINDLVGSILSGWAVGSPFLNGQNKHLKHHSFLSSERDPDKSLHASGIKDTPKGIIFHFILLLFGGQFIYSFFSENKSKTESNPINIKLFIDIVGISITQIIIFYFFSEFIAWWAYFILWVVPLFTLTTFFNGIRAFVEHHNSECNDKGKTFRYFTIKSNAIERFFISPMNFNYHAEHHLRPGESAFNLPNFRENYLDRGRTRLRTSYIGYIFGLVFKH